MSKEHDQQHGHDHDEHDAPMAEITQANSEELEAKLNEAEAKANEYSEKLIRLQAEFENTRRRVERDVASAHKYGLEKFALELLPVMDGLEQGLLVPFEHEAAKPIHQGLEMTHTMLTKVLEKFGITAIDPKGEPFNPEKHQALSMQEDPKVKPNTVIQVLQKGYMLQDRLLRPALVMVSK